MRVDYVDDKILVAALVAGETKAYAYVFDKFYVPLTDYAWRVLHDSDLAQDVVQSVFLKLYEVRDQLPADTIVKSYLYRMVYNRCLNELRHKKIVNDYEGNSMVEFYFNDIVQTPEAEQELREKEIQRYVDEAIADLPDRCREVYELKRTTDLSNQQIADQLGISVKTVEAQYTKALARLRKSLEWLLVLMAMVSIA